MKLILEGATPWDVDRVLVDFGMPMGPFAMSDLAGLDIGWSAETSKRATHPRNPVRGGPARAEDRRRLLRLRRGAQRQTVGACRRDHPRLRRVEGDRAAQDRRRGDPRALHLSDDQRGREDPRGGQGAARLRHRHRLDLRLRLAGLSRRPDVLCRHGRAEDGARQAAANSRPSSATTSSPRRCWRSSPPRAARLRDDFAAAHDSLPPPGEGGAPKARRMRATASAAASGPVVMKTDEGVSANQRGRARRCVARQPTPRRRLWRLLRDRRLNGLQVSPGRFRSDPTSSTSSALPRN